MTSVTYAQAFSFKFSARPGTPAAVLDAQLPEPVKSERLAMLQELLGVQQTAFAETCVGRTLPVLFERPGRYAGQLVGRSPYLQPVHAEADPALIGRIVPVRITECHPNSLAGVLPSSPVGDALMKECA